MKQNLSELPLPPGYGALKAFNRDDFRGMGRRREQPCGFARELNAVLVTSVEFFPAARHYPIVFGLDGATGGFVPVVITGLEDRQNLFVDDTGHWLPGRHVPAYVRRWPFFTVQLRETPDRSLVCVDPAGLEPGERPFIDAAGIATPAWKDMERLVNDMEGARRQTAAMMRSIAALELLEPFEAHAVARSGGNLRLGNMHRISEERLNRLPEKPLRQLMSKGYLSRLYAHLASLDNFQQLLDLRLAGEQHGGEA